MKETPQRLRSYAPPTRDKIFIWSAVIAGCGIMALLGRHAAITRFGTDEFTGNVLFAVFFVLTIGLYCGFQSAIESLFDRIYRKKQRVAIMSTPAGEEIEVTVVDEPQSKMDFSALVENTAVEEEQYFTDDDYPEDYSGGEIVEDKETDEAEYILIDGKKVYEGPIDVDDVVFVELEHNIREYSSLQERIEARGEYPYFEDYIGGHSVEEVTESDALYNEWVSLQPKHIRKELELGIYRVRAYPKFNDSIGCFTKTAKEKRIKEDNGNIRIEEWEEEAYISADGDVYYSDQLEAAIKALKSDKEQSELQMKLLSQHELCNAAHEELKEEDLKFSMAQIEFLCAYITHMMQPYLDADELQKLHHNAKIWTVHEMPPFTPVNLRSNHLTKEDLKHLGYNVGKFLRLQGGVIARFVKKVFEKPFESTQIRTIEQKLRESKSTKERIPIHTRDQMEKLFKHFQRYGNINLDILNRA
ncbi:putative uncharacterized protein [Prevotella sp. CAG:1031]|nr:putative uncharacterized protein [Prevotella sp. CAG:1031]